MAVTPRAVVTETYSDSSDEEFSSQEEELAHAVEDSPAESPQKHNIEVNSNEQDDEDEEEDDENIEEESVDDQEQNESDDDGDDEGDEDAEEGDDTNTGWADSIAKILKTNKPKKKKTLVLSKAKKLNDPVKAKPKPVGFQVEKEDGAITEEQILPEEDTDKNDVPEGPPRKKKRDIQCLRVKPNVLEKDRERLLAKIATKGVVQLFNAVKQQQKDIQTKLDKAGPLEVKRDKVFKSIDKCSFLDNLMGDKSKSIEVGSQAQTQSNSQVKNSDVSTWKVLTNDFMMKSNKMKDWNKPIEGEDEEETQMEVEQEMESD